MRHLVMFSLLGYLSGSVLYANVFFHLFGKGDMTAVSKDGNPGTANAFVYGGFRCGICTLFCDMFKGFLPVYIFLADTQGAPDWAIAPIIAAPVLGHIFSVFHKLHGGKGIAVTFGCLLGLYPHIEAAGILAVFFVLFSTVVIISPHFYRTLAAYAVSLCAMTVCHVDTYVWIGFMFVTVAVFYRLLTSEEKKERITVRLVWRS